MFLSQMYLVYKNKQKNEEKRRMCIIVIICICEKANNLTII